MAAKRKMVQSNLVKNSIAAYFAAIEVHNKPKIPYRYEIVTVLMTNAWELVLKAYIRKHDKAHSIFEKEDGGKTISLARSLDYVEQSINKSTPKKFTHIKENIAIIEKYRNYVVHYYCEQLEPFIFMVLAKSAINYVWFVKEYFGKDIAADEGLFILPIGFKLPFKVEDFFSRNNVKYSETPETSDFIQSIISTIARLDNEGISESVVVGFDLFMQQVKKCTNHELLVAITNQGDEDARFVKETKVKITDDPNAQQVKLTEAELDHIYPLCYGDVVNECKNRITGFKQGALFNSIMKELKNNSTLCHVRRLNPKKTSSAQTIFYSRTIVNEIASRYVL